MTDDETRSAFEKDLEEQITSAEAEAGAPEGDAAEADPVDAEVVEEVDPLSEALAQVDAANDKHLRLHAEFDNFRKRTLRENERIRKTAAAGLIRELLPVLDNLERALAHAESDKGSLAEGVGMIAQQFSGVLASSGLKPIVAVGEAFDPNVHEALTQQPSEEHAAGVVVQEFERGYLLGDDVLRPAKVVVSSGAPEATVPEEEE